MTRKKIGEILIEMQIIPSEVLREALSLQKGTDKRLGQVLEDMDKVIEEDIAKALATQFGIPQVKGLNRFRFPEAVLNLIDAELALSKQVFPLKVDGKILYLAMADPLNIDLQKDLSFQVNLRITPCVTTPAEIKAAIKKHYLKGVEDSVDERQWNILLVDDQQSTLATAEAVLKKEGYNIYKAANGSEGLKMAVQIHPQVIVTDIVMPRMSGIEMFNVLQTNHNIAHVPVIALSAKATAEEESRILDLGFFDFIAKPVNPIRLAARVRRAMRHTHRNSP